MQFFQGWPEPEKEKRLNGAVDQSGHYSPLSLSLHRFVSVPDPMAPS
ncbi:hypothetical protein FTV88_2360 [Heliorestis convoluta]|uniref:Uncharacterized protein n=1 Tax=Heliorestis convoluta TaxID=356322 RepID=A0A5Q2N0D9_9FIRM|nr:hypothetical protein FTV88_2360 [Heliorestis convoluta]